MTVDVRKLVFLGYHGVVCEPTLRRFDTILTCDRRTQDNG